MSGFRQIISCRQFTGRTSEWNESDRYRSPLPLEFAFKGLTTLTKQLHSHNGANEPKDQANEDDVTNGRNGLKEGVDYNLKNDSYFLLRLLLVCK